MLTGGMQSGGFADDSWGSGREPLIAVDTLPSTDAARDWLRHTGAGEGLTGLDRVDRRVRILDKDATQIASEKKCRLGLQRRAWLHAYSGTPRRS